MKFGQTQSVSKGVSACATCDGFFYKGQDVVVVGGGNTAVEEALYLSNIAKNVTVVHRRDKFRAEAILVDRLTAKTQNDGNTRILWNHVVDDIVGDESGVTGVNVRNVRSDAPEQLPIQGVFIAIGHTPNTTPFRDKREMDANGYLIHQHGSWTNVPGVFAAGDVVDPHYRQAITAAGQGCMAAMDAERYLTHQEGD